MPAASRPQQQQQQQQQQTTVRTTGHQEVTLSEFYQLLQFVGQGHGIGAGYQSSNSSSAIVSSWAATARPLLLRRAQLVSRRAIWRASDGDRAAIRWATRRKPIWDDVKRNLRRTLLRLAIATTIRWEPPGRPRGPASTRTLVAATNSTWRRCRSGCSSSHNISNQFARRTDGHSPPKGQHDGRRVPGQRGLKPSKHFVRVKKRHDMDNSNQFVRWVEMRMDGSHGWTEVTDGRKSRMDGK